MGILYTTGLFTVKESKGGRDRETFLQDLWGRGPPE